MVFDRETFRRARTQRGITLEELARDTRLSLSGLKKLQAGHRKNPRPDTCRRIAHRLGLPYGDLWTTTHHDHTTEDQDAAQAVA